MEFKDKVHQVRMQLFLSQTMLAKELGVGTATVSRWETGDCLPNFKAQKAFHDLCKKNNIRFEE